MSDYTNPEVKEIRDSANAIARQKLDTARKVAPEGNHIVVITDESVNGIPGYNIEAAINHDDEITVAYRKEE